MNWQWWSDPPADEREAFIRSWMISYLEHAAVISPADRAKSLELLMAELSKMDAAEEEFQKALKGYEALESSTREPTPQK